MTRMFTMIAMLIGTDCSRIRTSGDLSAWPSSGRRHERPRSVSICYWLIF